MNRRENILKWHRLHYQNQLDALENTKRRQWSVPYYILLLFAAIIGFCKLINIPVSSAWFPGRELLIILSWGISILGIYHVIDNHGTQARYRGKIKQIGKKYVSAFIHDTSIRKKWCYFEYFFWFTVPFIILITVGFVFVVLILTRNLLAIETLTEIWVLVRKYVIVDAIVAACFIGYDWWKVTDFVKKLPTTF
jgi:hypothetical protein